MKSNKIVYELTPELSEKLWNQIQQKLHDQNVSKEMVLHHLKQLKSQLGKEYRKNVTDRYEQGYKMGIYATMGAIDKKIEKIKKL